MISPNSDIKILKTDLHKNQLYQLDFETIEEQTNYFNNFTSYELEGCTYQRKDNILRCPYDYDTLLKYNYVMYKNTEFGDKWFYAFIDRLEFVNTKMTNVYLKTDVFQTYMFDIEFKEGLIERETVADDEFGANLIQEGLDTGDFTSNGTPIDIIKQDTNESYICVATTYVPSNITRPPQMIGNIYNGAIYVVFHDPTSVTNFLQKIDIDGKGTSVQSIFMIPLYIAPGAYNNWNTFTYTKDGTTYTVEYHIISTSYEAQDLTLSASEGNYFIPSKIANGYTPRNKKLLTKEFNYLMITNNNGCDYTYNYEDFVNNTARFAVKGVLTPGCSIKAYPMNYKSIYDTYNNEYSYCYGIPAGKYPICNWTSDVYTNWLTQNGINLFGKKLDANEAGYLNAGVNAVAGIIGLAAGNPMGASSLGNGIRGAWDTFQNNYRAEMTPPQSNGALNSGDVTFSSGNNGIWVHPMSIKYDKAVEIDKFFDRFGYKVNRFGKPTLKSRKYWNYIKMVECNLSGDIPEDDRLEYKRIFENGITIFHNPLFFMRFDVENIITI